MQTLPTTLDGCMQLQPIVRNDDRGCFVKTFQATTFEGLGMNVDYPEHFFSSSRKGVVRGMHFQTPPHAQDKVVYCMSGEILDVVLDLRTDSPTYGKFESFTLSSDTWGGLYIPAGFAHGFVAISDGALMGYLVGSEYAPENDTGVRWDSFGFDWPVDHPIVSDRDAALTPFDDYDSPFTTASAQ